MTTGRSTAIIGLGLLLIRYLVLPATICFFFYIKKGEYFSTRHPALHLLAIVLTNKFTPKKTADNNKNDPHRIHTHVRSHAEKLKPNGSQSLIAIQVLFQLSCSCSKVCLW